MTSDHTGLALGWQMTGRGAPRFWLRPHPKPGGQSSADLVLVEASSIANHTAIIAQSGSGKSYFLGRLVEDILLETKARCLVLDPNADFRKIHEIKPSRLWTDAAYDQVNDKGELPTESSRDEFSSRWSEVPSQILVRNVDEPLTPPFVRLGIAWHTLNVDLLDEDLDPRLRTELRHIHAFVRRLEKVIRPIPLGCDLVTATELVWFPDGMSTPGKPLHDPNDLIPRLQKGILLPGMQDALSSKLRTLLALHSVDLLSDLSYASVDSARYYLSKAKEYLRTDVVVGGSSTFDLRNADVRLTVVDLPSIRERSTRLLAIDAILAAEWDHLILEWSKAEPSGDTRVPTIVVVDEAHNLLPAAPQTHAERSLRDRFRTIVAEGRKYGVFLLLVSQRPEKLDPLVLSECENKAVMQIGSESTLETLRHALGLEDLPAKTLERCLTFERGRALIAGAWANGNPQLLYVAARRTAEGGRDLSKKHWARRPDALYP